MDKQQFRDALDALGLSRADLSHIIHSSWSVVDNWYDGRSPIPRTVEILLLMWLHPECPAMFRPAAGGQYELVIPDGYFTGQSVKQAEPLCRSPSSGTAGED